MRTLTCEFREGIGYGSGGGASSKPIGLVTFIFNEEVPEYLQKNEGEITANTVGACSGLVPPAQFRTNVEWDKRWRVDKKTGGDQWESSLAWHHVYAYREWIEKHVISCFATPLYEIFFTVPKAIQQFKDKVALNGYVYWRYIKTDLESGVFSARHPDVEKILLDIFLDSFDVIKSGGRVDVYSPSKEMVFTIGRKDVS